MRSVESLWELVQGRPEIDPGDLARAIEQEASHETLDTRTRMLIQESVEALRSSRGKGWVTRWLTGCPAREKIQQLLEERFEGRGFPSLNARIAMKTEVSDIEQFLRELGIAIPQEIVIEIGGSVALILGGLLDRHTEDIDVVDEVPRAIRSQHGVLEDLQKRYGLSINHFQSHYLPEGWKDRVQSAGNFGRIRAFLVDPYDIFLSKLFSARTKDRDDLRILLRALDLERLRAQLTTTCARLLGEARLREHARQNWYILLGEELPG